jgi:hypothetical protein
MFKSGGNRVKMSVLRQVMEYFGLYISQSNEFKSFFVFSSEHIKIIHKLIKNSVAMAC